MKKLFFTGLVILLPAVLTLMIIFFLFDLFTAPFVSIVGPFVEFLKAKAHFSLPHGLTLFVSRILSLILLWLFILLLGMITQLFLVRLFMGWMSSLFFRIPLIKTIYNVSKDIFTALFGTGDKKAFKRPVMIPFPSVPNYCLGFEAGEAPEECKEKISLPLTVVFVPTAPHPISGFLFLIPQQDVRLVDMTNEQVLKFLVSCGMIVPEEEK